MGRLAITIWRRAAGLVVACMLAVLVVGPFDAAICQADDLHAAAHAQVQTVSADDGGHAGGAADHAEVCVHGHAHAGPLILSAAPAVLQARLAAEAYPPAPRRLAAAAPPSGIDRPPRA